MAVVPSSHRIDAWMDRWSDGAMEVLPIVVTRMAGCDLTVTRLADRCMDGAMAMKGISKAYE